MLPIGDVNPRRRFPLITLLIIALNAVIFLYQITLPGAEQERFILSLAMVPAQVVEHPGLGALWSILTSMFLHGGIVHIAGNMLYLWIFGDNIEELMGSASYLIFYLVAGVAAAVAQILVDPRSTTPTLGASGAVAGVLGAYAVLFPQARIRTLVFVLYFVRFVELPALLVLGFWFILQLFSGATAITSMSDQGVAWFAHIGGFAFGLLVGVFYLNKRGRTPRQMYYT